MEAYEDGTAELDLMAADGCLRWRLILLREEGMDAFFNSSLYPVINNEGSDVVAL